jgi:signal transduction histidine kinase
MDKEMATKKEPQRNQEFQTLILDREFNLQNSSGELFLHNGFISEIKIGQPVESQLSKLWNKNVAHRAQLVVDEGKSFSKVKTFNSHGHSPHAILISLEPLVRDDRIAGITFSGKNISKSVRMQKQVQTRDKMSHLSILAAKISDKLNNPLASVLNRIGYLLVEDWEALGTLKLKHELEAMQDQLFSMSIITNALQSFSKDAPPESTYVNINDILSKTIDLSKFLRIRGNVNYQTNFESELPPIVGCEITLEQAFLILVQNALEAMPKGGTITISSTYDDISHNYVNVIIEDTGVGIPSENMNYIFDPFFKTKNEKHTGLGLSICYGIIINHRGSMDIKSKENKGTKVSILLPIYSKNNKGE